MTSSNSGEPWSEFRVKGRRKGPLTVVVSFSFLLPATVIVLLLLLESPIFLDSTKGLLRPMKLSTRY